MQSIFLASIPALAILTFVITIIAFTARARYMMAKKMNPQKAGLHTKDIPPPPTPTRQLMDNYNHLLEQPTVFYAIAIAIAVAEHVDLAYVWMAWIYVALRLIHSLIQCTINKVMARFYIFMLAWLVLGVMSAREIYLLLS